MTSRNRRFDTLKGLCL